jgi:hypothetical protein
LVNLQFGKQLSADVEARRYLYLFSFKLYKINNAIAEIRAAQVKAVFIAYIQEKARS